jgi:hypothetical protein
MALLRVSGALIYCQKIKFSEIFFENFANLSRDVSMAVTVRNFTTLQADYPFRNSEI